ncbi:MAG: hypothetical protein JSW50_01105 [Candidatus Latescibacterota bacterium]|nr:MAG: hypothetical protein JSW50_01105 [Candidatus Latescibacterota bacterium]
MEENKHSDDALESTGHGDSGESAPDRKDATNQSDFDCSKMMEIVQHCCPDKMKSFSDMMSKIGGRCCPPEKEDAKVNKK